MAVAQQCGLFWIRLNVTNVGAVAAAPVAKSHSETSVDFERLVLVAQGLIEPSCAVERIRQVREHLALQGVLAFALFELFQSEAPLNHLFLEERLVPPRVLVRLQAIE